VLKPYHFENVLKDPNGESQLAHLKECARKIFPTLLWVETNDPCYIAIFGETGETPPPAKTKPKQRSRGLGDTVAKITTAMGIKPCGKCKERQAKLNALLPYAADENAAPKKDCGCSKAKGQK
jgi:hypothetical protein